MRAFVMGLVILQAATGLAADQSIGAVKLTMTRSSSGREKLSFTSKDVNLLFPPIGTAWDPSLHGLTIDLVSPQEPPVTLSVPPGVGKPGWKVIDSDRDTYSYRNSDAPQGSVVRALSFREGRGIKLLTTETGLALAAAQGSVGIRITTYDTRRCALFDAPTVRQDGPNRFVAKGAIATGGDCSNAALGAVIIPGCGNGELEPGEQCDGSSHDSTNVCQVANSCVPPGQAGECTCCDTSYCYVGNPELPCCPGSTCAPFFPPLPSQGYGAGTCVTSCVPLGSECVAGLPCCSGTCAQITPNIPIFSCQ